MSLSGISSNLSRIAQYIPIQIKPSLSANKIAKLVVGVFAIHALTVVPKADAGFGFFTLCMAVCNSATGGAFIPACVAACVASLGAPTP